MGTLQQVSVIVVTCGISDYLKSCLDSIGAQTYAQLETIVIDNSLNPNLSREITASCPSLKLYVSPENLSYCASLNKGIGLSTGAFILCLNDDVVLDKRFIEEALRGFFIDNKVGLVSGKILRSDRRTIDSTGLFLSLFRTAKERGYGLKESGEFEKSGFIFGVSGAVAFYRRRMLEELKINPSIRFVLRQAQDSPRAQSRGFARSGLTLSDPSTRSARSGSSRAKLRDEVECVNSEYFDYDYHFFYEDLDIAWRANRFGWRGYYIPEALAYHIRGASARRGRGINKPYARRYLSDELHIDLIKNRYLTIIKNEPWPDFLLHVPFIALYDLMAWVYILIFRPKLIIILLSNLKYVKSALKKRKFLAQTLEILQ